MPDLFHLRDASCLCLFWRTISSFAASVRSCSCQSPPYSTPGTYPPPPLRLHDTDSSRSTYSLCRRLLACSLGLLCPLSTPWVLLELAHEAFQRLPSLLEPPSTQPLTLARPPQDLTSPLQAHRDICLGRLRSGALRTVGPSSPSSRSKQANSRHILPSWAFRPCSVASPLLLFLSQRRQTLSQVRFRLSLENHPFLPFNPLSSKARARRIRHDGRTALQLDQSLDGRLLPRKTSRQGPCSPSPSVVVSFLG